MLSHSQLQPIMRHFSIFGALVLASYVSAQNVTYCPGSNVCYAVNIPANTASTGSGDIYFQITGPSSMSWIGLGQGSSMTGANIFMIYADAAGTNVTLSPRLGTGEVQPKSDTTAQVTLLGGSGITDGVMTANVRCSNCNSWSGGSMSFTDSSSDWIWAYLSGNAISSDSVSANVGQHSKYGTTSINLQDATGGSSSNPFLTTTATSSTSGNSTSSSVSSSQTKADNILMAHAILAPVAFALLFPLGAIGIRALSFPGLLVLHAGWMAVTLSIAIVAMGLGIWYAVHDNYMNTSHAVIGIVAVVSLFLQPMSGFLHHRLFKSHGRPNFATYPHIWWGRSFVTLGIINGGLGLRLTGRARKYVIVYGVLAGIIWGLWMTVVLISFLKGRGNRQADMGEELVGMRSGPENGIRKSGLGPRYSESVNERNIQDSPLANSFSERRTERN